MLSLISCIALAVGLSACGGDKDGKERHKHNYIEEVTAPTCTAKGFSTYTCECGSSYTADYVDPLDHDFEGDTCKRCDYVLHDHVYTKTTVEPSCNNGGYTKGVCDICGASFTVNYDALGHKLVNGKCKRCDYFDSDKHGHEYEERTVEPDCFNQGYTAFTCWCGQSYNDNYTDPLGHNYIDGKCTRCNDIIATDGLEYTLSDDGEYYICTGIGTATETEIVIASEYNGKPVTTIGEMAFRFKTNIKSVIIPNGITDIGASAFSGCSGLTSIVLSDGVISIESFAFSGCSGLTCLTIPDGVTTIGYYAFNKCSSLESLILPDSLTSISYTEFESCSNLKYNVYDNAKYLGNDKNPYVLLVKAVNKDIRYCNIHKNTKIIYQDAFLCCDLANVVIPDSVTHIDYGAFGFCEKTERVTIGSGVTFIDYHAFYYCNKLKNIYYNGTKKQWNAIFKIDGWDESVSSYTIHCTDGDLDGRELEYAPSYNGTYYICTGIGTLTAEDIVIKSEYNGKPVKAIGDKAFYKCYQLKSIIIPDSVTAIGNSAFEDCFDLTEIQVPDTVTSIGRYAFAYCGSLTSINIPDRIEIISEGAYRQCSSVKSITIPDSVTQIGKMAFYACAGLTSVTVPDSVVKIGDSAFGYCRNLQSITIGSGVKEIGKSIFEEYDKVTDIYYKGTRAEWVAIKKDEEWDGPLSHYIIHCTDGQLFYNK